MNLPVDLETTAILTRCSSSAHMFWGDSRRQYNRGEYFSPSKDLRTPKMLDTRDIAYDVSADNASSWIREGATVDELRSFLLLNSTWIRGITE